MEITSYFSSCKLVCIFTSKKDPIQASRPEDTIYDMHAYAISLNANAI